MFTVSKSIKVAMWAVPESWRCFAAGGNEQFVLASAPCRNHRTAGEGLRGVHEVIYSQTTAETPPHQTEIGQPASPPGPLQPEHRSNQPCSPSPLPWYANNGHTHALTPFKRTLTALCQVCANKHASERRTWVCLNLECVSLKPN